MVSRNLALAYARREKDVKKAIPVLEAAVAQDQNPRFIAELDQMYEAAGFTPAKRLAFFEQHQPAVRERDDVLARQIVLLNQAGQYDRALELLSSRKFHIWEEAFENAHDSWVNAHLLKGHALMKPGKAAEALKHYRAALEYPENLGVGKPYRGDRSASYPLLCRRGGSRSGEQGRGPNGLGIGLGGSAPRPCTSYDRNR